MKHFPQLDALRPLLALPVWQCVAGLAATVVVLIAAYIFAIWMPLQNDISNVRDHVKQQQSLLRINLRTVRDLPRKQREFEVMKKQLKMASRMLPEKSQIPDLLDGVSRAGQHAGLEFTVFQPMPEIKRQWHAEVPVLLSMTGSFRQLALFLNTVGEMQRIVDVKNLSLKEGKNHLLEVSGEAVTYRLLDDQEIKQMQQKKPAARRKRR